MRRRECKFCMKEGKSDKFKQILKEMLETILGALIMAAGVSLFLFA